MRERGEGKKRSCHSIFHAIILFAFIVTNRYEVSGRAMSTAIQTIPSFSVFDHGDRFSLVYTKLLHMTNRGLLPFNLLRSASFASYHLPDASRFTYGHGHPVEYDDSRFFCLLLFLYEFFFIPLIFILLSLLFFFVLVLLVFSFGVWLVSRSVYAASRG